MRFRVNSDGGTAFHAGFLGDLLVDPEIRSARDARFLQDIRDGRKKLPNRTISTKDRRFTSTDDQLIDRHGTFGTVDPGSEPAGAWL